MKTVAIMILSISLILYSSGFTIQFSPFKITLPNWMILVGVILITIGISFIAVHHHRTGKIEAYKEIREYIINIDN